MTTVIIMIITTTIITATIRIIIRDTTRDMAMQVIRQPTTRIPTLTKMRLLLSLTI